MANESEITFKDLQMDERYKRLERTLKLVLMKNAETRGAEYGNTGAWPSISSINGDNLDTSCAAMSVQSSRIGSEVVASSSNLRNMMMHKKSSSLPRNRMVTSSENQFPISKDKDSVMMPPPRTPGPLSARSARFGSEVKRSPLLNVPSNFDRSDNSFAQCSVSQCPSSRDAPLDTTLGERSDYHRRNPYEESRSNGQPSMPRERIFSRWKVMLNDKLQLIIKGTLECGKVARSKPVIRRLAATSVQSIFKHTYHLHGNLVDERNELPEYVSGKFYNGFPDDWENVCQVWRNYVNNGSRLSFRWPTPITDSDDDIKSEITEITYPIGFGKAKKSRSPRKSARYSKPVSPIASAGSHNNEQSDRNQYVCSQVNTSTLPLDDSIKLSSSASRIRPNRSITEKLTTTTDEGNRSSHDTSTMSLNTKRNAAGNLLKDMIQEDKLNIIIENLTNKNCSLEYVHKIVEMFDCMKYVASYQSTESTNTENSDMSKNVREPCEPNTVNKSNEEPNDRRKPLQQSMSRMSDFIEPNTSYKSHRSRYSEYPGRRLTKRDYDSSESENDSYDTRKRNFTESRSADRSRTPHGFQDSNSSRSSRIKQGYPFSERDRGEARLPAKFNEESVIRGNNVRDSSLSEEDFSLDQRAGTKEMRNRALTSPRKSKIRETQHPRNMDNRDSSVSLSEDDLEKNYKKEPRAKITRRDDYDSSVSIIEDERDDVRIDRTPVKYPKTNSRPVDRPIKTNSQDNRNLADGFVSEHQEDSAYMSLDTKRQKVPVRVPSETESTKSSAKGIEPPRNAGLSTPTKTKIQAAKKPPVVVSSEIVNLDMRQYDPPGAKNNENDMNAHNAPRKMVPRSESTPFGNEAKNTPTGQKYTADSMLAKAAEAANSRVTKNGTSAGVHDQNKQAESNATNSETVKTADVGKKTAVAEFGSEDNPKQLTGWVPAVISDDDDDSKCRLVFVGKLLNEAGHVVNRKFTTDFVKRRVNPKLIETIDGVFYNLVGDLNDTKHMVPKEMVKLCHNGCPFKINAFCAKWMALSSANQQTPKKSELHNTSVDCLRVPTSSRGRRILPPLNYWTGERVTTRDNRAIYSPGNSKELSLTSSLENTNGDTIDGGNSPKTRRNRVANHSASEKRTESDTNGAKKKSSEKISPPAADKSPTKISPHTQEAAQKKRSGKRRLAKKKVDFSSESDGDEYTSKAVFRKRSTRAKDLVNNASTAPKRTLRNTSKNTGSPQSLEQSASSHRSSFEKSAETETKSKLRKRQKINPEEEYTAVAGTSKQMTTKTSSGITCTFYKNVPLHDGNLSEDQLSTY